MVEICLKSNPIRLIWYPAEESPSSLLDTQRWRYSNRPRIWRPPTDVYETEDAYVVRVEVAGMRESDFSVFLDERHLLIAGTRTDTPERRAFHQMEIPFGEFIIEIDLPQAVSSEGVEAFYREGFLKVTLPKAPTRRIHIKEAS